MQGSFRRSPDVEMAPMKAESILFNPANNKFCVLNHSASLLWAELERPRTLDELVSCLCSAYEGVARETAFQDVRQAIQQLIDINCVVAS